MNIFINMFIKICIWLYKAIMFLNRLKKIENNQKNFEDKILKTIKNEMQEINNQMGTYEINYLKYTGKVHDKKPNIVPIKILTLKM